MARYYEEARAFATLVTNHSAQLQSPIYVVTGGGPDVGLPHLGSITVSFVTEQPGVARLFLWDPVTQVGGLGSQESLTWVSRGPSGTWLWVRIPLTTISIRRRGSTPLPEGSWSLYGPP